MNLKLKREFTVRIYQEETLELNWYLVWSWLEGEIFGKKITQMTITLIDDCNQITITKNHDSRSNDRWSSMPWQSPSVS